MKLALATILAAGLLVMSWIMFTMQQEIEYLRGVTSHQAWLVSKLAAERLEHGREIEELIRRLTK